VRRPGAVLGARARNHRTDPTPVIGRRRLVLGQLGVGRVLRREQRYPDVFAVLESSSHPHADARILRREVDQIGDQSNPGVGVDGDVGDDERRRVARIPLLVVHRHADDDPGRLDVAHLQVLRPAVAADRARRVQQRAAPVAAREAENAVAARFPEGPALVVDGDADQFREIGAVGPCLAEQRSGQSRHLQRG